MQIKIIEKHFGGVEFTPEMRVLHLGGQSSANVERMAFQLPESWQGKSVTLHIQRQDGTMPSPILLDENNSCAVGKEFTASPCGQWMLLALGEDGFRALTRPAKYDCYETLATDGDAEISPTQYEAFVAQVVGYSNAAQSGAKEARNAAAAAKQDANKAEAARMEAATAASEAGAAQSAAEGSASRAERAADRAELIAPSDGAVRSVNGKGGVVTLTAEDLGAVVANSAGYVKSISLTDRTLTLTFGDGSTKTMQTKDTTTLENMTGILSAAHGGTGKNTPLTAEDVGAVEKGSGNYLKGATLQDGKLVLSFGNGSTVSYGYNLPTAASGVLGGIKVGDNLSIDSDGTVSLTGENVTKALTYTPAPKDEVTQVTPGLMSAADKKKLDGLDSTGAIAASGNNYIRFADGTQICWKAVGRWQTESGYYRFNFPVPFVNKNYAVGFTSGTSISTSDSTINSYVYYNARWGKDEASTNTSLVIYNPYDGSVIVIGRWK